MDLPGPKLEAREQPDCPESGMARGVKYVRGSWSEGKVVTVETAETKANGKFSKSLVSTAAPDNSSTKEEGGRTCRGRPRFCHSGRHRASRKLEAVRRMLRGESLATVSRGRNVPACRPPG